MKTVFWAIFNRRFWTIEAQDGKGNVVRPGAWRVVPRFKWVGPVTGWRDDELMRELTGKFIHSWGLMICNDLGLYNTFLHRLKWEAKSWLCLATHFKHDRGGMFDSCSRCAK